MAMEEEKSNPAQNVRTDLSRLGETQRRQLPVTKVVREVGFGSARFETRLSVPLATTRSPRRDVDATAFRENLERLAEPNLPSRDTLLRPRLGCASRVGLSSAKRNPIRYVTRHRHSSPMQYSIWP